ncbi:Quinolinate phosphoribosyl transferase [Flagelloscypha sp. PMI_526]|nr:Quinolinate phosphoribosyl transferase [Flagelloscypha sp. PMI_526]
MALSVPYSILDTDLYKISMQQAALQHFPDAQASYKFKNRNTSMKFTQKSVDSIREAIHRMLNQSLSRITTLNLTSDRVLFNIAFIRRTNFLETQCTYLTKDYLDYLSSYRYYPSWSSWSYPTSLGSNLMKWRSPFSQEDAGSPISEGALEITIAGPWHSTILWEVPLMAIVSEIYFLQQDTDWSMDGQGARAFEKGQILLKAGCAISEFGSRRRRSFTAQDIVLRELVQARDSLKDETGVGVLAGTSNVYFAMKHGLRPIGTIAHEWFMGIAAIMGYEVANKVALKLWEETYPEPGVLKAALTDTFSSEVFFRDMAANPSLLSVYTSLRQDSGDALLFAPRARKMYEDLGLEYRDKTVIYSDGLDVPLTLKLQEHCTKEVGMKAAFGIGTNLTNDFTKKSDPACKSKALNIVVKLATLDGKGCVKISDDLTKNTGAPDDVDAVKELFNIPRA